MNQTLRILQIEDCESDAELVVRLLERAGYSLHSERVDSAAGLRHALASAGWDVIICDYRLPQFDAPAALRIVQQTEQDIPFLIVSASIGEERAVEMMKTGAHDYLMKDNLARLAPAVEREVREARDRRERRQAEERLRLAISATQLGTFDFHPQTGELVWSAITREQFGLAENTPVHYDAFLACIHPDDRSRVDRLIQEVLQQRNGKQYAAEYRTIRALDGAHRWISSVGRTFFDAQGLAIRFIGVTQDITERRSLEDQLRQAQKLESIGRLAGGVAHDFNNLLTVILGYTEMISGGLTHDHELSDPIGEIGNAAVRAAALTRQLLTFSRRQVMEPQNILLNDLVSELEKMLRRLIGEDIDLVISLDPESGVLRADPAQIEQVIVNLVVNSRDAMPGGGRITIETACCGIDPGEQVVLRVSDTGMGMTDEVQSHVFEPFFTTKDQGKGTGLGLATVYGIVKQSNGTIKLTSAPGIGSTFELQFPRVNVQADSRPDEFAPVLPVRHKTVLLAEDEQNVREFVRKVLTRHGYTVLDANNGRIALELSRLHPNIDLLLADVVMPEMSGPELIARFGVERPGVPALLMSGYSEHRTLPDASPPGILQKPFTSAALLARLEALLSSQDSSDVGVAS